MISIASRRNTPPSSERETAIASVQSHKVTIFFATACSAFLMLPMLPSHALESEVVVPPEASSDCTGDIPIVVASDAAAQSDLYSASTLAGALGTDCIILAGPRSEPMSVKQQGRFNQARHSGFVVGGLAAVPISKLHGRHMTRISGSDRWETAALVGQFVRGIAAPESKFASLTAGKAHTCGLHIDGTIDCWGSDQHGLTSAEPIGQFVQVSSGEDHACALDANRAVVCWGGNDFGQTTVPSGEFLSVAAGFRFTCALRTDRSIQCWGSSSSGKTNPPPGNFESLTAGIGPSACALRPDNTAACWGADLTNQPDVLDVPAGPLSSASAGFLHACGIRPTGAVECWGRNDQGQTDGADGRFTHVTAGHDFTCALQTHGTVTCWGNNRRKQTDAPTGRFASIAAGGSHVCGIRSDSEIECWGNNSQGQHFAADSGPYVSR